MRLLESFRASRRDPKARCAFFVNFVAVKLLKNATQPDKAIKREKEQRELPC